MNSVLDLVLGEWMLPAHERRAYWIPYGELPPPPKGSPTAGAVPLPSSAVEGAAEWVMARDKNGRLAWHIAAEQVRGVLIGGGGSLRVCECYPLALGWARVGELAPPTKCCPTAGAVPLPSSAVAGAAEWVMAQERNGRLAWHIAAEQVCGFCVSLCVFYWGGGAWYIGCVTRARGRGV